MRRISKAEADNLDICYYRDAKDRPWVLLFKSFRGLKKSPTSGKLVEFEMKDYVRASTQTEFIYMREYLFIKVKEKDLIKAGERVYDIAD